jgi:hypothetical protein
LKKDTKKKDKPIELRDLNAKKNPKGGNGGLPHGGGPTGKGG